MQPIDLNHILIELTRTAAEVLTRYGELVTHQPFFSAAAQRYPHVSALVGQTLYTAYDGTEQIDTHTYSVTVRIVMGQYNEDYVGHVEQRLYQVLPAVGLAYRNLRWLDDQWGVRSCELVSSTGLRLLVDTGALANQTQQIGCDFVFSLIVDYNLDGRHIGESE